LQYNSIIISYISAIVTNSDKIMADEENRKTSNGFRTSQLPHMFRASARELVKELDTDGDGWIDNDEFVAAVEALKTSRSRNTKLYKIIILLSCVTFLLVGAMFAVSIAAANLAKDTTISTNGYLQDKRTLSTLKTKEATIWSSETEIVDMTPQQLSHLKTFALLDGGIKFDVTGYARTPNDDKIILLVNGGTITWDNEGITDATGDARYLLDVAFGVEDIQDISTDGRNLSFSYMGAIHCRRMLSVGNIYRRLCGGGAGNVSSISSSSSSSSDDPGNDDIGPPISPPTYQFSAFDLDCHSFEDLGGPAYC